LVRLVNKSILPKIWRGMKVYFWVLNNYDTGIEIYYQDNWLQLPLNKVQKQIALNSLLLVSTIIIFFNVISCFSKLETSVCKHLKFLAYRFMSSAIFIQGSMSG
jgi:hypothetical protein